MRNGKRIHFSLAVQQLKLSVMILSLIEFFRVVSFRFVSFSFRIMHDTHKLLLLNVMLLVLGECVCDVRACKWYCFSPSCFKYLYLFGCCVVIVVLVPLLLNRIVAKPLTCIASPAPPPPPSTAASRHQKKETNIICRWQTTYRNLCQSRSLFISDFIPKNGTLVV